MKKYTFLCLLANLIMFGPMGFPLEGSWLLMVLNSILLIVAAQCVGCFIGSCVTDPPLAMSVSALYSAMSFSFSGFSFPIDSMPPVFQWIAWLYPIRQYFLNYSDIAIFGNGFANCWPHFCALLGFGIVMIVGAAMLDWQQRREAKLKTLNTTAEI